MNRAWHHGFGSPREADLGSTRAAGEEVVGTLGATTERTFWSRDIPSPARRVADFDFGPNSTTLVVDDERFCTSAYIRDRRNVTAFDLGNQAAVLKP